MQTKNPLLDEMAKAFETAIGLAQAGAEEAKTAMRAQGDRLAAQLDLVRRDELEAVRDTLMAEIASHPPLRRNRREVEPIGTSRRTLAEHYERKTSSYRLDDTRYDRALRRLFNADDDGRHAAAAGYLRSVGPRIGRRLARDAQLHPYVVEHTMEMLIHRLRNMHLHLRHDRRSAQRAFGGLVRRVAVGILKRNRENYAL